MEKEKKKGFTLIELLITLAIASIIFVVGFFVVNNIIENSNEKSRLLSEKNIIAAGKIYSDEFNNEINWIKNAEKQVACISIEQIIESGLLKKADIVNEYKNNYVLQVIKDENATTNHRLTEKSQCLSNDITNPILELKYLNIDKVIDAHGAFTLANKFTLEATMSDLESGIKSYGLCYSDSNTEQQYCDLKTLDTSKNELTISINLPDDLLNKYFEYKENIKDFHVVPLYFQVKDDAGNTVTKVIEYRFDLEPPIYEQEKSTSVQLFNGVHGFYSVIPSFRDDDSNVKEIRYLMTQYNPAGPEPSNDSGFLNFDNFEPPSIDFECQEPNECYAYALFAVAEDNMGNVSDAVFLQMFYPEVYNEYSKDYDGYVCDIICSMEQNSRSWLYVFNESNMNSAQKKEELDKYHSKNIELSKELPYEVTYENGYWYDTNGELLYDPTY